MSKSVTQLKSGYPLKLRRPHSYTTIPRPAIAGKPWTAKAQMESLVNIVEDAGDDLTDQSGCHRAAGD